MFPLSDRQTDLLFRNFMAILFAAIAVGVAAFEPLYDDRVVSRGVWTELSLMALGNKFDATVSCATDSRRRVTIRAWTRNDAKQGLSDALPDCEVAHLRRQMNHSRSFRHL